MSETIIKVNNLTKVYKEKDIFKQLKSEKIKRGIENISFEVKQGEMFSIIGLNGAGKTTLLKCLLGLIHYDKGNLEIFGEKHLSLDSKALIGYLPEISYYPKDLKLIDLMFFYGELYGIKKNMLKEKIMNALKTVELDNLTNEKLSSFSKGMLQKVGIAQAILNNPKLLFLDEPMSGLDPLARRGIIKLLEKLKENGTTVFLNTHILNDIERIGERVLVMHKGKIKEELDLRKVKKDFSLEEYFINIVKGDVNV